ncbi:MAG: hypothetical protein ACE5HZ_07385 [Fidelibacterota bacterium]
MDGYNIIGCDALNVGTNDFGAGLDFLMNLKESAEFPFISANIVREDSGELLFDPYVIVGNGDLTFAVIGLTTTLPRNVENLGLRDPVAEGKKFLQDLSAETDYQIILFNGSWKEVSDARGPLADAEFIFLSGDVKDPNWRTGQPAAGPKLYRLGKQGKSLGVIRMSVESMDGPLTDVTRLKQRQGFITLRLERLESRDPSRNLEEMYKGNPRALESIRKMKEEASRIEGELARFENTVEFDFVAMGKSIRDDPTLLSMVSSTLSACSELKAGSSGKESVSSSTAPVPGNVESSGRLRQ